MRIKSFVDEDKIICRWTAKNHHQAFPGILNGGIIGSVLDCHCNWSAAYALMKNQELDVPPCTVTAQYTINLHKPTPVDKELFISANIIDIEQNKAKVEATMHCEEKLYATCSGLFVAVKEGHPAYHRW